MVEELARWHLIRPVLTQGHMGDILADKIIYDAQTTSGGSGGPLFNTEGKVIGVVSWDQPASSLWMATRLQIIRGMNVKLKRGSPVGSLSDILFDQNHWLMLTGG